MRHRPGLVKFSHEMLPSETLRLGFGCSGLLGRLTRRESLILLETALDCGITYFDTARMYGAGSAEGILGQLTPRVRQNIIIASKAGILPARPSILSRSIYHAARSISKIAPKLKNRFAGKLKKHVPVPKEGKPQSGMFNIQDLRTSLETSLRELRTDYLDIFLLHECASADLNDPDLLSFLQSLQREGKIRKFGVATGIEETAKIVAAHPTLTDVVQIPNSIWQSNICRLTLSPNSLTITHSCLKEPFHTLANQLLLDEDLANTWRSMTQTDPHSKTAVAQLLLAHALRSNANGVVLFSSSRPENVKASAKVICEAIVSPVQIDGLTAFMTSDAALSL